MEKNHRLIIIGNLLALSAAICWGFNEPANKFLIPSWISAPGVAVARIFGAALLVWLASLAVKTEKIERGDRRTLMLASVFMLGFVYVFSLAFNTASPIDISIILTFQPMLVVLIHVLFMHERVNRLEMLGMGVAFVGALIVILGGGAVEKGKLIGDLFAVICAVSYAAYLVIIEKPSRKYKPVTLMRWIFLFTAILCLPLLFTVHGVRLVAQPEPAPVAVLGFIIVFPTFYCYLVTAPAIRYIGSELVSLYQYLVPVIATVVSLLMKIDTFHWYQPVSFVIIVTGLLIANHAGARKKPAVPVDNAKGGSRRQ